MLGSVDRLHQSGRTKHPEVKARLAKSTPAPVAARPSPPPFSCSLPLPVTGATIPAKYEIRHDVEKAVKTLLAFLDLGMVSETDLVEPWQSEREILRRAFYRFIEQEGSDLALFSPRIVIADSLDDGYTPHKDIDNNLVFSFYSTSLKSMFIGNGAARIEEACPGLGETLLYQIDRAVCATLYCVTPACCLDLARYIYWQGEDDEREVVAERLAEGESIEDMDVYRRSDYLAHIPEWAAAPTEKLSLDRLREIARSGKGLVPEAAKAALDLAEQQVDGYQKPSFEEFIGDNVDPALFVRWSENDDVDRVFDDFYEYAVQGECTEMHGYISSQPDKDGIGKALEDIRQFFRILRALERSFCLIGERIEEGV